MSGLKNRRYFAELLEAENQNPSEIPFVLLFIDLDRFKPINDIEGHEAGDQVLTGVAKILESELKKRDFAGRFGGDEFIVMLHHLGSQGEIDEVCGRIQQRMQTEIFVRERLCPISASIGVSVSNPLVYSTAEAMLHDADVAMYAAKASEITSLCIVDEVILERERWRRTMEHEIQTGIENSEFELHYQPIVRLSDKTLKGFEALVRWEHPERGMIPPSEFIGIAERTGLIVPLGEKVLRDASDQLGRWKEQFPQLRESLAVNVNVSPVQLEKVAFAELANSIISNSRVDASAVSFEITESVLMSDGEDVIQILHDLRDLGCGVVLDDFGTGYSSLSYLDQLPVNTVKIDRSFVRKIASPDESDAIVRMILALADMLEMSVVAEGVETEAQANKLKELNCPHVQGYLYGKPMDIGSVNLYLADLQRSLRYGTQYDSAR